MISSLSSDWITKERGGVPLWSWIVLVGCVVAYALTLSWLAWLPMSILFAVGFLTRDIRQLYIALLASIPISIEVVLSIGLGTDVPTEQLMWILSGLASILFVYHWYKIPAFYVVHPISVLLLAILSWIGITTIASADLMVSVKYLLAKCWYMIPFYGLSLYVIRSQSQASQAFGWLLAVLTLTVVIVLIRHSAEGFSFATANLVLNPFYRNHVNYACLIAISLPYAWWYAGRQSRLFGRRVFYAMVFILFVGLLLSYTRAAIVAVIVALVFRLLFINKWLVPAMLGVMIGLVLSINTLMKDYGYMRYAPNFETTIMHWEFDEVLAATYRFEDVSTMERVYRWVAGYRMILDRPILGFGPGNFYPYYKRYTLSAFETWVSDNEDHSGIHNYYLMLWVEQGLPGLILFIAIVATALLIGQQIYRRLEDRYERSLLLAAATSLCIILIISLMNDMLETDKVGGLFLVNLAMVVRAHYITQSQKSSLS